MKLEDISVVGGPLVLTTSEEVDAAESQLGADFPSGYREYVTTLGEGVLGGCYIRIYPPRRILDGLNNQREWRDRIDVYWFWAAGHDVLTKDKALECIIVGDTFDGDELIFHPSNPDRIYVLPRHFDKVFIAGDSLFAAMEWLCSSGTLTEAFTERIFEPFDSRKEH